MTHNHSILSLSLVLVSSLVFGCAAETADNVNTASQASEKAEKGDHDGYGYEMMPLALDTKNAPAGDALMPNGRVAPEEIVRQAVAKVPTLRGCYEEGLKRDSSLQGEVIVRLAFEQSGALRSSKITGGTMGDAAVGQCIEKALASITPPATSAGHFEVIYPVKLAPEDLKK